MSIKEIEQIAIGTDWKLMAKIFKPTFSLYSLANSNYLDEFLFSIFGNAKFEDLKIPFAASATDINSGKAVLLDKGNLITAIKASIFLPIIFSPVSIAKRKLMDGGLVNPILIDALKKLGANKVIAVNLRRFETYGLGREKEKKISKLSQTILKLPLNDKIQYFLKNPIKYFNDSKNLKKESEDSKIWRLLYQTFIISQVQITELHLQLHKPNILIEPDTSSFKLFDFTKANQLIDIGYQTAKKELVNLRIN